MTINVDQKIEKNCVNIMLTNARSLLPKLKSLVDAFQSLELHCAAITETWFKGGMNLRRKLEEIEEKEGLKVIHKSRDGRGKKVGGGVAIVYEKRGGRWGQQPGPRRSSVRSGEQRMYRDLLPSSPFTFRRHSGPLSLNCSMRLFPLRWRP